MTKPAFYACRLGRWCKCDDLSRVDCNEWRPVMEVGPRFWFFVLAAALMLIGATLSLTGWYLA